MELQGVRGWWGLGDCEAVNSVHGEYYRWHNYEVFVTTNLCLCLLSDFQVYQCDFLVGRKYIVRFYTLLSTAALQHSQQ